VVGMQPPPGCTNSFTWCAMNWTHSGGCKLANTMNGAQLVSAWKNKRKSGVSEYDRIKGLCENKELILKTSSYNLTTYIFLF